MSGKGLMLDLGQGTFSINDTEEAIDLILSGEEGSKV